jgi:hypothetical protein
MNPLVWRIRLFFGYYKAKIKYIIKRWADCHLFIYTRQYLPAGTFGVEETPELIPSLVTLDGVENKDVVRGNTIEGWVDVFERGDDGDYVIRDGAIPRKRLHGVVSMTPK